MKKIFSILLMLAFLVQGAGAAYAESSLVLSDTTRVNVDNTSADIYAKPTSDEYHADSNNYMHMYTTGDYFEINQSFTQALTAGTYTLTFHGKGTGALWYYQAWGTEWAKIDFVAEGEDIGDGWKKYTRTIETDGNGDTGFLFHSDGALDLCIDNISLVDASGVDYVKDGGFDNPSLTGGISNDEETKYARIESEVGEADNTYSLHMYTTGTSTLEISQSFTQELTAGTYTLTAYMKGTGALWYYQRSATNDWGSEWAKFDMAYAAAGGDGWCKFEKVLTVDGDKDANFLFYTEGAADLYIDDISLVDANGVDYVPDGGFGEVTVGGGTDGDGTGGTDDDESTCSDRYKNKLELSETTVITGANGENCKAEATEDEFRGDDGFGLYVKTGASDDIKIKQTLKEACTAGEYVLTFYAKPVSGTLWFCVGDGNNYDENAWLATGQSSELQTDGWAKYQKTLTVDGTDDTTLFFYNDPTNKAAEFYIDDISLVPVDGTENLIPDGGFSEVTVTPAVYPDYEVLAPVLKKGAEKVEAISGAGAYTVTVKAKNNALEAGVPVELLVAVFDSTGEMVNLYSDSRDVAMSAPTEPDTVLSVPFTADEGYSIEVYAINNRQDIDVYYNPVSY